MLDRAIDLLEVRRAGVQRALGDASCIDGMAQGKEVMYWRLPGPEACRGGAAQLVLFRQPHQPSIEQDCVQPLEGLAHSNRQVVGVMKDVSSRM